MERRVPPSKRTNCVQDEACARVTDTIRPEIEARKRKREDERAKIKQPRREGEGETAPYIGADQPRISKQCSREVERFASSTSWRQAQRTKREVEREKENSEMEGEKEYDKFIIAGRATKQARNFTVRVVDGSTISNYALWLILVRVFGGDQTFWLRKIFHWPNDWSGEALYRSVDCLTGLLPVSDIHT